LASSGSRGSIDSSSRGLQTSTRIIDATTIIGFVIEAMRKIASLCIGSGLLNASEPSA
jgi:hypothetical protein